MNFEPNSGLGAAGCPVGRRTECRLILLSHWLPAPPSPLIGGARKVGPCAPAPPRATGTTGMNWSLLFNTFWEALSCSVTSLGVVLSAEVCLLPSSPIFHIFDGLGKNWPAELSDLPHSGSHRPGFCGCHALFNCCLDYPIFYPIIVLSGKAAVLEVERPKSCMDSVGHCEGGSAGVTVTCDTCDTCDTHVTWGNLEHVTSWWRGPGFCDSM